MTPQERYRHGFIVKCARAGVSPTVIQKIAGPLSREDFVELRKQVGLTDEAANLNYDIYLKRRRLAKILAAAIMGSQGAFVGLSGGPAGVAAGAGIGAGVGLGMNALMQHIVDKAERNQLEHRRKGEVPSWWAM